ncbi:retrovirus-related pol polyprotein LINE-1 [Tanacetum coccineum]
MATVYFLEGVWACGYFLVKNKYFWNCLDLLLEYLGKTGKYNVEETLIGWFITYIDRDSEALFKENLKNKRAKADIVDEEKQEREIIEQIERAEEKLAVVDKSLDYEEKKYLMRDEMGGDEKRIMIRLAKNVVKEKGEGSGSGTRFVFNKVEDVKVGKVEKGKKGNGGGSVLDELIKEEEKAKERSNRNHYWLCEGIVVKVMSKDLADKGSYKQKGVVRKGRIEALDNNGNLRSCPSGLGGVHGCRGTRRFDRLAGTHRIRVGSWNVGSLTSKLIELSDALGRHRVDIACFQENKLKGSRAREGNGYKLWYSGSSTARNGVGVMVAGRLKDNVVRVTRRSDRIMAISVVIDGETVNVISAYAPQVSSHEYASYRSRENILLNGIWSEVGRTEDRSKLVHGPSEQQS